MDTITESIESNMKTNRKVVRLSESKLRSIVAESVRTILRENEDDFIGHGYDPCDGNREIQFSDSGDGARIKYPSGKISDWMEIEFDEDGVAYVVTPNGEERLDRYYPYPRRR